MGRGSDTRIYAPRSESSHMYRDNHEEDDKFGPEDGYEKDKAKEKKQIKREKEEKQHKKLTHIKIKPHHIAPSTEIEDDDNRDDSTKIDADREITAQTGPPGNSGYLTSLATQAKGPGAAAGQMVQMSEPMRMANQLLKDDNYDAMTECSNCGKPVNALSDAGGKAYLDEEVWCDSCLGKSKPMDNAWSELLKRQRGEWEAATGPFKKPKGGFGNESQQSNRRAKYVRRENPTGPMAFGDDTSVEYSHRGLSVKQPMSQADIREYRRQIAGIRQGKKHLGNIRRVGPSMRTRSDQITAPKGVAIQGPKPRLHPVRAPPIQPPKMKMPHLNKPRMPSMVTMSQDSLPNGILLKAVNKYHLAEVRNLMREMRNLLRDKRNDKKKSVKDVSGGASTLPKHPANGPKQTTRPQGGTEDATNDAQMFGLQPTESVRGGTA